MARGDSHLVIESLHHQSRRISLSKLCDARSRHRQPRRRAHLPIVKFQLLRQSYRQPTPPPEYHRDDGFSAGRLIIIEEGRRLRRRAIG